MSRPLDVPGFAVYEPVSFPTPRGAIRGRRGGDGPPLLLLHGFPQTHVMWHGVAAALAERFEVFALDLPGYGDSFLPEVADDHAPHGKRAWADDLVLAMPYDSFAVIGHDRGGRVAYRMALDHPSAVTALAALDIVPTGPLWDAVDADVALGYWHWAFLAQPAPLPERMIGGDLDAFWLAIGRMGLGARPDRYPADVLAAYRDAVGPAQIEAMCEDYRAGASVDRALDDAETDTIACPARVLWAGGGALPHFYADPLDLWRGLAPDVTGRAIDGASHFLVEDEPDVVAADLLAFLA